MNLALTSETFELLREHIEEQCGVALAPGKEYLVRTRLGPLLPRHGCGSFPEFLRLLQSRSDVALRDEVVDAMTTNETLWFRDEGPWAILRETLLPTLCRAIESGARSKVRIWSAACSTGQEPYSIAISILDAIDRENRAVDAKQFEILGTDVSPAVLSVAEAAIYSQLGATRGLGDEAESPHFEREGAELRVAPHVRELVSFRRHNLQESFEDLGSFDIVFCRNVLIYFSESLRNRVIEGLTRVLRPGGALILGASESLRGSTGMLTLERSGRYFYYRPAGDQ